MNVNSVSVLLARPNRIQRSVVRPIKFSGISRCHIHVKTRSRTTRGREFGRWHALDLQGDFSTIGNLTVGDLDASKVIATDSFFSKKKSVLLIHMALGYLDPMSKCKSHAYIS